MMGWSPGCYITSFVESDHLHRVPEKKILTGFYHMGRGGHLGHVTSIMSSDFHYLKAFIQSLVQISTVVSGKIKFEFLYVHDLWPRSRNDIDFQYSHTFIYSIRSQLQLPFRSLAAIVSEKKTTVFIFS